MGKQIWFYRNEWREKSIIFIIGKLFASNLNILFRTNAYHVVEIHALDHVDLVIVPVELAPIPFPILEHLLMIALDATPITKIQSLICTELAQLNAL